MTAPLAVVLAFLSAGAWAAPCPVVSLDGDSVPAVLEDSDPVCRAAVALAPHAAKLRAAAGFASDDLPLVVITEAPAANAYYWHRSVALNDGLLRAYPASSPYLLFVVAHETGHAVQDRDGDMGVPGGLTGEAKSAFLRRREAHADSIAAELFQRAGYPRDSYQRGREASGGCGDIRQPPAALDASWTHPEERRRWLNGLLAVPRVSARAAAAPAGLARLDGASPDAAAAAFTGATARAGAVAGPALAAAPAPYRPLFKLQDFDDSGRLLPGRLASSDLRLAPPPPGAGPVREHARLILLSYTDRMADATQAVVNWWYGSPVMARAALRACGRATGEDYGDAVLFGAGDWSREAAVRAAVWLRDLVR